ncbi:MAG: ribosomal-processing cysteine protease Prp [Desulfosporosinus sp.]
MSKHSRRKGPNGIRLIIWADEQERIRAFELCGHAGYADSGQDIVCAGISALSVAACNGLEHFLSAAPKVQEADGFLTCKLEEISEQELEKAQWILQTMVLGIEQIHLTYGQDYIFIDRRRWTPC